MKINLVLAPMWNHRYPPISLGYLTAYLRDHGHTIFPFDLNIELHHITDKKELWETDYYGWERPDILLKEGIVTEALLAKWTERLLKSGADLTGFSIYNSSEAISLMLAERLKAAPSR